MPNFNWPAWWYGPNNAAQIFAGASEVPEGWVDHPRKVDDSVPPAGTPLTALERATNGLDPVPDGPVDKSGWPWDATRNTANKAQTASGLWQLLPCQSRPLPKVLDL